MRNYYPRATFPDIQLEEFGFEDTLQFNGEGVCEWNLDGLAEHQIMRKLEEITMAATAFRTRGNNEISTVKLLVNGFTGNLKGWWDHALSPASKATIESAVKIEVVNGVETRIEQQVETLILAISARMQGSDHIKGEMKEISEYNTDVVNFKIKY